MPISASESVGVRLGVDVGGTFTDLAALVDGQVVTAKVPSTPADQSVGVMNVLTQAGLEPSQIAAFAHGTTVATNALLERRGARTALVTTEGFRDVLEIGRQCRPDLYDLTRDRPPALVPRELRFTVRERMGPDGELQALDEESLAEVVEGVSAAKPDAIAVCLLFGFLHPEHEQRVGEALRRALPSTHVSLSSEVLPEFREFERFSTTTADAYLAPRLGAYLRSLAERVADRGVPAPTVMQSSGGVTALAAASTAASTCVLSGPAGGVVGAAYTASASGYRDLLTFDMGGTSTDVAPILAGEVQTRTDSVVTGVPLRHPMVDVHTVSAGGGSIARADAGGALRVGPESAGADPGPAAYDNGGTEPTVTDANVLLGYLADGARLGGEVVVRRDLAEQALVSVGESLGLDALETALGVVEVANAEMVRALRVISVERGLDPRDFALVAFGGAGGMHACALADELNMTTVLVPRAGGVLSALGLAVSDVRRDYVRPLLADLDTVSFDRIDGVFAEMVSAADHDLDSPRLSRFADLRYHGQAFELTVDLSDCRRNDELRARFDRAHEHRRGYAMSGEPVELVNLRLVATVPTDRPAPREPDRPEAIGVETRQAYFDGAWLDVEVHHRVRMGSGARVDGPAVVEFPESTCVVAPGWQGEIDASGTLVLRRR